MPDSSRRHERILEIYGFHGTRRAIATEIVTAAAADPHRPGLAFRQRDWAGHWLGQGVYVWQDAPRRAREWAIRQFSENDAAVLGVRLHVRQANCIDLFDIGWERALQRTRVALLGQRGTLPSQQASIRRPTPHPLDCLIIDTLVETLRASGRDIYAVRAPFAEGRKVYPRSAFYDRGHVQIAIRNRSIIQEVWLEEN